jgi:dCMP deaminase
MTKFDKFYMSVAEGAAALSHANRLKVGAVAVDSTQSNILAFGYNGTLPGESNQCEGVNEDGSTFTLDTVLHAEENLMIKMSVSTRSLHGATIYLTHAPCMKCARMLAGANISNLVYRHQYRDRSGIDLLIKRGVVVEQV